MNTREFESSSDKNAGVISDKNIPPPASSRPTQRTLNFVAVEQAVDSQPQPSALPVTVTKQESGEVEKTHDTSEFLERVLPFSLSIGMYTLLFLALVTGATLCLVACLKNIMAGAISYSTAVLISLFLYVCKQMVKISQQMWENYREVRKESRAKKNRVFIIETVENIADPK